MYAKYYDILMESGMTNGITLEQFKEVLQIVKPNVVSYKKNAIIKKENETIGHICMMLSGIACGSQIKPNGQRSILELFKPGDIFAQIVLFADTESKMPARVIAKTDCTVMYIDAEWFTGAKVIPNRELSSQLMYNFLVSTCNRAQVLCSSLAYFKTKSIRERVAAFLYEESESRNTHTFMLHYNREELADYLCIPRPSLSRELSSMKKDGIIDFYKSTFKILDIDALKKFT